MPYQWCAGHCLNLCIGKACKEKLVKQAVHHVQQISFAYEYSAKRQQFFHEELPCFPKLDGQLEATLLEL